VKGRSNQAAGGLTLQIGDELLRGMSLAQFASPGFFFLNQLEVGIMDGVLLQTVEALDASQFVAGAGEMWELLQAEKEEVEREILSDGPLVKESAEGLQEREPSESCIRDFEWQHRETLDGRLRALNNAQDRLMDGGYGRCLECGEQINPKRLAADPALSLCLNCQTQAEAGSIHRSL
jgi:DnaK suppressor protein